MVNNDIRYGDIVNTPIGRGIIFGQSHPSEPDKGYWVMHKFSEVTDAQNEDGTPNLARGCFSKFHRLEDVSRATNVTAKELIKRGPKRF